MITPEEMCHHLFIETTDRKSLFTQIKGLVTKAKNVARDELQQRRQALQKLLEYEDKIYEEEFANKVKSRIDEDIKKRKDALLKIKEERARVALEFLESKRIQQYMESCYEIREALRRKETLNVKETQLEQITEKERQFMRERGLDKYWENMMNLIIAKENNRQVSEDCLRQKLLEQYKQVLAMQLEDVQRQKEEERRLKAEEAQEVAKIVEELRLEDFDRQIRPTPPNMVSYRKELEQMIAENKAKREAEERERADEHRRMCQELTRLEKEELEAAAARKRAFHNATLEYIQYVKGMRKLEEDAEKLRNDRIDDLCRVDICTKRNIKEELARKAKIAALCHAELKRQICEEYERRLRDQVERREDKIIENRFAKEEMTREELWAKRIKMREDLDKQIAELKIIRAEQETQYQNDLRRAIDDPEFCAQLAEQYIRDGVDYLPPHANWLILGCPQKEYIPKKPVEATQDEPPEGKCIVPCGCDDKPHYSCGNKNIVRPENQRRTY